MTTYPLSEPATIHASDNGTEAVAGQGSLADCAEMIEQFSADKRAGARIEMDDMDLRFGPSEIDELLHFLREESPGLSNRDISALADPDG